MKTHLYDFNEDEKVPNHNVNKKVGYRVTYCGYQRINVTRNKQEVTCKLCLREIERRNKQN